MKNLENFGVQELNAKEIRNTDGGFLQYLAAALLYFAVETVTNPVSSGNAFVAGLNGESFSNK